jgi:hypothetical protein
MARGLAAAFLGCSLLGAEASTTHEVSWALHPRVCADGVSAALRVPCGSLGVLAFEVSDQGGCLAVAAGSETPHLYSHPAPALPGILAAAAPLAARSLPAAPPSWVAVLDWADAHGESVLGLVEVLASGAAVPVLYALDGPDLAALGPAVGDQHVLARLCAVAENAIRPGSAPPITVNMSFGRLPQPSDPTSGAGCEASSLACQIAKVLAHLKGLGTVPVAAAGNHQDLLFPASLGEALAAAPLDVTWFLSSQLPGGLWQAPEEVDVLLPGHALCVEGAVVPAGSSYASAFFSGWYAFAAGSQTPADPFAGLWAPAWSPALGCYVLGQEGTRHGSCNPGLADAVAGIVSGSASGCWGEPAASGKPVVVVSGLAVPVSQPPVASFDEWAARQQHPAPESDPCIPCVGGDGGGGPSKAASASPQPAGGDVLLNLSASVPFAVPAWLERVYFRVEDDFYPLALSPGEREALASGELGGLVLAGYGHLLPAVTQPSLVYVFTTDPATGCAAEPAPATCFWSSTPVLLP